MREDAVAKKMNWRLAGRKISERPRETWGEMFRRTFELWDPWEVEKKCCREY